MKKFVITITIWILFLIGMVFLVIYDRKIIIYTLFLFFCFVGFIRAIYNEIIKYLIK